MYTEVEKEDNTLYIVGVKFQNFNSQKKRLQVSKGRENQDDSFSHEY